MSLLRVRNLEKSFPIAGIPLLILRGIDFEMSAGERLALVGPSGCGKSTLLQILAGLDHPDNGEIRFDGQVIDRFSAQALALLRRREIGIVFQFFNLFSSLTLLDNVLLPGVLDRRASRPLRARAAFLLDRVGLTEKIGARVGELSGGEMQRAALCRALLLEPKLILADEPTGNLDSENRRRSYELLQTLTREQGAALLMATHDPGAAAWVDRSLAMRDGRLEP